MSEAPASDNNALNVKCVLVGDHRVGKTALSIAFTSGEFQHEIAPTVFANYVAELTVDDVRINLGLFDTAGQPDYDRLLPLSYPNTDVFMVLFSVVSRSSFESVRDKWHREVGHHSPATPIILVGTKSDLITEPSDVDTDVDTVSPDEAHALANEIGARCYIQCSARLQDDNLSLVFAEAARAAMERRADETENDDVTPAAVIGIEAHIA